MSARAKLNQHYMLGILSFAAFVALVTQSGWIFLLCLGLLGFLAIDGNQIRLKPGRR